MGKIRFHRDITCPVCGGSDDDDRGEGIRCYGFLSEDRNYLYCTREEYANGLQPYGDSNAYAHIAHGRCNCGKTHGEPLMSSAAPLYARKDAKAYVPAKDKGKITHEWFYRLPDGTIAYRVTRHLQPNGAKTYCLWHWENGAWVSGLGKVARHLYQLPELSGATKDTTIYIVEGEKCCDALASVGLLATTNVTGAGKWNLTPVQERHEALRGHPVVILPDNDETGRKHALQVAQDLYGVASSVKIVSLPQLPSKGDIADWLTAGRTREELETLVSGHGEWEPTGQDGSGESGDDIEGEPAEPPRFRLISRAELNTLPPPQWLIHGVLPLDALSFTVGPPKSYKSFVALAFSCCIVTDTPWNGHKVLQRGPVVYLAGEGLSGINKRVTAWEKCNGVEATDLFVIGEAVPLLQPDAVGHLIALLNSMPVPPIMIVIDTLSRAMVGGDPLSSKEIMQAIAAADRIRHTVPSLQHVMIVHHKNKSDDILGSISIPGGADTVIDVAADGTDVVVSCSKQKDFDEFTPMDMLATPISVDENPEHDSVILTALNRKSEAAQYHLKRSEFLSLSSLVKFGLDGATATDWERATVSPGIRDRTFFGARSSLEERGFVETQQRGRGGKYVVTPMGHIALREYHENNTALTANSLQMQGVQHHQQSPVLDTPPLTGGVSKGSLDAAGSLAVSDDNEPDDDPHPYLKPMPKGPCGECKRQGRAMQWIHQPAEYGGNWVCDHCLPRPKWKQVS